MGTHDAIIVGGGLGGLSCGAHLARKGWKVLVLEKNAQPGGYCVSFRRGDYIFDLMTMLLGVSPGQLNHQLFQELGVADKLEFIKPKHLGRFIYSVGQRPSRMANRSSRSMAWRRTRVSGASRRSRCSPLLHLQDDDRALCGAPDSEIAKDQVLRLIPELELTERGARPPAC